MGHKINASKKKRDSKKINAIRKKISSKSIKKIRPINKCNKKKKKMRQ